MRERTEGEGPKAAAWAVRRAEARPSRAVATKPQRLGRWAFGLAAVAVVAAVTLRPTVPDRTVDTLRAAGLPVTAAEMKARLAVPPAENAAPLMREIARTGTVDLAMAEPLPRYRRMDMERNWSDAHAMMYPEYAQWRQAGASLAGDAVLAAREGFLGRLDLDLRAGDALADLVAQEPTPNAALVSIAIVAATERAAQEALRVNRSAECRDVVRRYAASRRPLPSRARALVGEGLDLLHATRDVARMRGLEGATVITGDGTPAPLPRETRLPWFLPEVARLRWRDDAARPLASLFRDVRAAGPGGERKAILRKLERDRSRSDGPNPLFSNSSWRDFANALPNAAAHRALTDGVLARLDGRVLPRDPWAPYSSLLMEDLGGGAFRLRSQGLDGKPRQGPPGRKSVDDDLTVAWPRREERPR